MPSLSKRGDAIDHLGRIEKVAPHGSNHTSAQKIPRGPNKVNYNSNWQVFHYLALKIATNYWWTCRLCAALCRASIILLP
jgi:hypothetical protein